MFALRRPAAAAAAIVTAVLLAGCSASSTPAPSTPTVTVTASPTVTPTPTPDTTNTKSVSLGADALTVTSSEGTIFAGYYEGPTSAVAALSTVLGTVQPTFLPAGKCNADQTTYDWGTLKLTYLGSDANAATTFVLSATKAPTAVDIETAHGARVGGDWKSYIANVAPGQPTRNDGTYDSVLESMATYGGSSTTGTVVTATNGVISSIAAPQEFNADC